MSGKFEWCTEIHTPKKYEFNSDQAKAWKEDIVETAGFVPLEVRFKQMEQAGYRARFNESEFSSRDISDMYLNHPEFDITPEDDFEEMIEKTEMRNKWINYVKEEVRKRNAATDSKLSESETKAKRSESAAKADEDEEENDD